MASKAVKGLQVLDFGSVAELYRRDVPKPVDVLNLIHFKDRDAYSWYGVLVAPALRMAGGKLGWIGQHVASLHGESRAEELLVVRYPSHHRFLWMVLSPYYIAVANPVRVKGVRQFEASFTYSGQAFSELRRSEWVLVVHFNATTHEASLNTIRQRLADAGGELVYDSYETSEINLTKQPTRSGTNPLVFKSTAMFRFADEASCRAGVDGRVVQQIRDACQGVSIQLYHRSNPEDLVPKRLQRVVRRRDR